MKVRPSKMLERPAVFPAVGLDCCADGFLGERARGREDVAVHEDGEGGVGAVGGGFAVEDFGLLGG